MKKGRGENIKVIEKKNEIKENELGYELKKRGGHLKMYIYDIINE